MSLFGGQTGYRPGEPEIVVVGGGATGLWLACEEELLEERATELGARWVTK
jgi:glycine/D-amino acid oxidase-like deaminating enzyme